MTVTITTAYKWAAVNENWAPLSGVEVEALNLTTLKPDDVQRTGLDGIVTFVGLPAGPHIPRVRARRVSTKVGGRTYTGQVRLIPVAMGNQGITKHYVVDANGMGTHTTVQAAVTAATAAAGATEAVVIYLNPGEYREEITINGAGQERYFLVGEGAVGSLDDGFYAATATIRSPVLEAAPVITQTGGGTLSIHGLAIVAEGNQDAFDLATNVRLEVRNSLVTSQSGYCVDFTTDVHFQDSIIIASNSRAFDSGVQVEIEHCYINVDGLFRGNYGHLYIKDCFLLGDAPAGEYWLEEVNLTTGFALEISGCKITAGGGAGFLLAGEVGATERDLRLVNNEIALSASEICFHIVGVNGGVVTGNVIKGTNNADGSTAIRLTPSTGPIGCSALVVANNSIREIQNGLVVDANATDGTCVLGPNGYQDVGTDTSGVPAAENFQVNVATLGFTLTRGDLLVADASSPSGWTVLNVGAAGTVLIGGTDPSYSGSPGLSGTLTVDTINEYTADAGVTIEGCIFENDHLALGAAVYDADKTLNVEETYTHTSGVKYGAEIHALFNPASSSAGTIRAIRGYAEIAAACAQNLTASPSLQAFDLVCRHSGSGTATQLMAFNNWIQLAGAGDITTGIGMYISANLLSGSAGDLATFRALWIANPTVGGSGSITNLYGLYIKDLTQGTSLNYAIYLEGTSGLARQGIWWNGDTNLYRSAANVLKTDDAFHAAGAVHPGADADFTLSIVSSNPRLTLDSGDYIQYTRSSNVLDLVQTAYLDKGTGTMGIGTSAAANTGLVLSFTPTAAGSIYGLYCSAGQTIEANDAPASAGIVAEFTLTDGGNNKTGLVSGLYSTLGVTGTGTHTLMSGLAAGGLSLTGACTVTEYRGVDVRDVTPGGSGTVTTQIGLYIEALTSAGTNIAIQSLGGEHRFVGDVKIGADSAPSEALDVVGNLILAENGGISVGGTAVADSINVATSDTDDPYFALITTNTAHEVRILLDESAATDHLEIQGQTASVDTILCVKAQTGESAIFQAESDAGYSRFIVGAAGALNIKNTVEDADIRLTVDDGGTDKYLYLDGATFTLLSSTGLIDLGASNLSVGGDITHTGSNVGFFGTTPAVQSAAYSITNDTAVRALDCNDTTIDNLADVVGTLVKDLQALGLVGS